jgi:hypothetical protein
VEGKAKWRYFEVKLEPEKKPNGVGLNILSRER